MESINYRDISTEIITVLKKHKNLLIVIQGSPDPDAIASSFFLKQLGNKLDCKSSIVAGMNVSLPQNRSLIKRLSIPVRFNLPDKFDDFDGYIVVDFQNPVVHEIPHSIPCVIHIDHHTFEKSEITPEYALYPPAVNSVSTILAGVLIECGIEFEPSVKKALATALAYGIRTDTDNLTIASDEDKASFARMEEFLDNEILEHLSSMPYSEETLTLISKAMLSSIDYKSWLIAGLGYIPIAMRDSLAITADYMLEQENVTTVVTFALIHSDKKLTLDASFRTTESSLDLNHIIKSITQNGGARSFKGAFQIDMDYFSVIENRSELWEIVNTATISQIKKARDNIVFQEVRTFFSDFKKHLTELFH